MDFSKMSTEEIQELISNTEKSQPQESNSFLDKAGKIAGKFNELVESSRLPAFAGGLLQGAGDVSASLGNVIARPLGHPIPHPNLAQYLDKSPATRIAFGAGELGSQIPLYTSGAGLLGKAGLTAEAGLSGRLAEGLASGALMGENKEGNRIEGVLTGAAIPLAGKAFEGISKLKSKNIAQNVMRGFENAKNEASNQFNNVFKEAESRGIKSLSDKFNANIPLLKKQGDQKYIHSLKEFNKNPTLSNAHDAQSDLAKYATKIGRPSNALERKAKEEAKRLSNEIRAKLMSSFHRSGNVDLALQYNNARQFYKNEVGPYLKSKSIKSLESGDLRPKNFANKIQEEESFMSKLGQRKHPEIEYRRKLKKGLENKLVNYGIGAGLGGLGFYGASRLFK